MASSHKLANQVLKYIKSNIHGNFCEFNAPQLAAIEAALTRRMTMIQGVFVILNVVMAKASFCEIFC